MTNAPAIPRRVVRMKPCGSCVSPGVINLAKTPAKLGPEPAILFEMLINKVDNSAAEKSAYETELTIQRARIKEIEGSKAWRVVQHYRRLINIMK